MEDKYYARVIVHGVIPAEDAESALKFLSERIREGLGPDPDDGHREFDISIAAGAANRQGKRAEIVKINEAFLKRLQGVD